jgi:hypothetical protein
VAGNVGTGSHPRSAASELAAAFVERQRQTQHAELLAWRQDEIAAVSGRTPGHAVREAVAQRDPLAIAKAVDAVRVEEAIIERRNTQPGDDYKPDDAVEQAAVAHAERTHGRVAANAMRRQLYVRDSVRRIKKMDHLYGQSRIGRYRRPAPVRHQRRGSCGRPRARQAHRRAKATRAGPSGSTEGGGDCPSPPGRGRLYAPYRRLGSDARRAHTSGGAL